MRSRYAFLRGKYETTRDKYEELRRAGTGASSGQIKEKPGENGEYRSPAVAQTSMENSSLREAAPDGEMDSSSPTRDPVLRYRYPQSEDASPLFLASPQKEQEQEQEQEQDRDPRSRIMRDPTLTAPTRPNGSLAPIPTLVLPHAPTQPPTPDPTPPTRLVPLPVMADADLADTHPQAADAVPAPPPGPPPRQPPPPSPARASVSFQLARLRPALKSFKFGPALGLGAPLGLPPKPKPKPKPHALQPATVTQPGRPSLMPYALCRSADPDRSLSSNANAARRNGHRSAGEGDRYRPGEMSRSGSASRSRGPAQTQAGGGRGRGR
ncbi:hypothetical protein B0H15DRAFT_33504 [Mycena belliarum]|uniref:Uncharacterized protein n=1 Tax=Mycena belliarum TaxID=1033014 RepID=A0AAD6XW60_9AGAR|nr:hypothetical protein B0H15DRAFT_33504 [Mycena belliae]